MPLFQISMNGRAFMSLPIQDDTQLAAAVDGRILFTLPRGPSDNGDGSSSCSSRSNNHNSNSTNHIGDAHGAAVSGLSTKPTVHSDSDHPTTYQPLHGTTGSLLLSRARALSHSNQDGGTHTMLHIEPVRPDHVNGAARDSCSLPLFASHTTDAGDGGGSNYGGGAGTTDDCDDSSMTEPGDDVSSHTGNANTVSTQTLRPPPPWMMDTPPDEGIFDRCGRPRVPHQTWTEAETKALWQGLRRYRRTKQPPTSKASSTTNVNAGISWCHRLKEDPELGPILRNKSPTMLWTKVQTRQRRLSRNLLSQQAIRARYR